MADGHGRERPDAIWRGGEDFQSFVEEETAAMRQISKDIGVIQ